MPTIQWWVAGVALLVVLASFGLVLYEGVAGDATPPVLAVVVDSIAHDSATYRVHVTVVNTGGRAAADVRVRAEVVADDVVASSDIRAIESGPAIESGRAIESGPAIESGLLRFELLAPGSRASGVFVFSSDPRAGRLRTRVVGHVAP